MDTYTGHLDVKANNNQVTVASVYERVADGAIIGRSVEDVIRILKETKTNFIYRGWWRFHPCPESPLDSSGFFTSEQLAQAAERGYTYEHLRTTINAIKAVIPDTIFCGAIGVQFLNARERNPITGDIIDRGETWEMALNPEKWGIALSKYKFQESFARSQNWVAPEETYNHDTAPFYFPDITNPDFQELFLIWVKKQIDCGADAIWIDFLFTQATLFSKNTKDPNHPAVKESFKGSLKVVDEIHAYGVSKGKNIYVGTWSLRGDIFPSEIYQARTLDFVTNTPKPDEVLNGRLDNEIWVKRLEYSKEISGDIPFLAFIDWADDRAPMAIFSQRLTPEEQRDFLEYADEFFQKKGINLIYPVHGGFMGASATRLAFGEFKIYDSLAPEFQTYETIKELAKAKAKPKKCDTLSVISPPSITPP